LAAVATARVLLELRALGFSDRVIRRLIEAHGGAAAALRAHPEATHADGPAFSVSGALATVERLGATLLTDADFPDTLLQLTDPPLLLYARGRLDLLHRPIVAIVGSRRCTAYGQAVATEIAKGLGRAGVVVVSGLARGIDAAAHSAALSTGTIAVMGCGVDVAYPPENSALQERIAREGLLLTEFDPGEPPIGYHFPRRNRLIAALAAGVVVVEASSKSGSLTTADHALDLGREVFAVPGPVDRETSAGTHALLRDGARLVTCAADVLEELGLQRGACGAEPEARARPPGLTNESLALWELLDLDPVHVDLLARRSGLAPAAALAALCELELGGHARQLAGMRYVRG
jgi:DNA processing protein